MRKFRNRLALVAAFPAFPIVMLALVIRGEDEWWEPLAAWWRDFVKGE